MHPCAERDRLFRSGTPVLKRISHGKLRNQAQFAQEAQKTRLMSAVVSSKTAHPDVRFGANWSIS
jgi:hypothetical protein